jgi:hypothetical protein
VDNVKSLVAILEVDQTYDELWAAAITAAQRSMHDELEYWLVLYKIKKDGLWMKAGFDSQEEWIQFLATIGRQEGGCSRSSFFDKINLIERLERRGVSNQGIVMALSMPTAAGILVKAPEEKITRSLDEILEEIHELNPGQAALTASEIVDEPKIWVAYIKYDMRGRLFTLAVSEDVENDVDTRVYLVPEVTKEDAEYLAKTLRKKLEWV